jgi:actin-related protein
LIAFVENEASDIHDAASLSIIIGDVDIRINLYSNSLPSDGTTLFAGIGEQMTKEFTALAPSKMRLRSWHRLTQYSAGIGGPSHRPRAHSSRGGFQKEKYDEPGPTLYSGRTSEIRAG